MGSKVLARALVYVFSHHCMPYSHLLESRLLVNSSSHQVTGQLALVQIYILITATIEVELIYVYTKWDYEAN